MQITIYFDGSLRDNKVFFNAMFTLAKRYNPEPARVGFDMGINVTNLSWNEVYKLAADFVSVIRIKGSTIVDGLKITIGEDDTTAEPSGPLAKLLRSHNL